MSMLDGLFSVARAAVSRLSYAGGAYDKQQNIAPYYSTEGDGGGGVFEWRSLSTTAADGGTVVAVSGVTVGRWHRLFSGPVRPRWFGAVGDGVTSDTAALQACFGTTHKTFDLEGLTYSVTIPYASYLAKWTSQTGITIRNGTIVDTTVHTTSHGTYTQCFWFDACTNIRVLDVNYTGTALTSPESYIGYRGASFVYLTTGTQDVEVRARVRHAAHGVITGDYANVSLGSCKNIRATLDTYYVGYPWASYLADDLDVNVTSDTSHRSVYLTGCNGANVVARFKNQYLAPIQVILGDALSVMSTASIGCRNIKIEATDLGSTTYVANSWCCGISTNARQHAVTFENIDITTSVRGTDAIASTLGSFVIANNGSNNWHTSSVIRNITLRGCVDRSAQTIGEHASGEIHMRAINVDSTFPICENILVEDFTVKKGVATPVSLFFYLPGLTTGGLHFSNCSFVDHYVYSQLSTTGPTTWVGCAIKGFSHTTAYPQTMYHCVVNQALGPAVASATTLAACSVGSTTVLCNVQTYIVASTTQTQGQMPLVAVVNDIITCANANDTVTLPPAAPEHPQIWVLNNGANTLKIYPSSGCDLGAGTNTSTTLAAGGKASWAAIHNTIWRRLV